MKESKAPQGATQLVSPLAGLHVYLRGVSTVHTVGYDYVAAYAAEIFTSRLKAEPHFRLDATVARSLTATTAATAKPPKPLAVEMDHRIAMSASCRWVCLRSCC
jgi:hypothetical protein